MSWSTVAGLALISGMLLAAGYALRSTIERMVTVAEKKADATVQQANAAVEAAKPKPPPERTPREKLPASVLQIANQWSEPWAREQAMDFYCELYDEVQDWNVVQTVALSEQAKYLQSRNSLS